MGKVFDEIDDRWCEFIRKQKMFFVATAPSSTDGHINLSPKGTDSLRVIDRHTIAYADLVGSGVETIAHLKENGRIVIMFCSFDGAPKIFRIHGTGDVLEPSGEGYRDLIDLFPDETGMRSVIRIRCHRISDSCGFGVPVYEFREQRPQMRAWAVKKGPDGLVNYQREHNSVSIDGLPGVELRE